MALAPSPAKTVAVAGLGRFGISRFGWPPLDTRPEAGMSATETFRPRYSYTEDPSGTAQPYSPEVYAATIVKGSSWTRTFNHNFDNGSPIDLTGATALMRVLKADGSVAFNIASYQAPPGNQAPWFIGITINGPAGTVTPALTAGESATLTLGTYTYTLVVTDGDMVFTLAQGGLVVS